VLQRQYPKIVNDNYNIVSVLDWPYITQRHIKESMCPVIVYITFPLESVKQHYKESKFKRLTPTSVKLH